MLLFDSAQAVSRERTPEGFLRVRARIARAGLHDYKAGEIGGPPGAAPDATVRVYRPIGAVFDQNSMASFAGKPVTIDHPPVMVDAANWRRYAVGHSGGSVGREGDHLTTDLVITDAAAVARAEAGAELSNGYWADFVFTPGRTPDGVPYDALQQNIRGNHIALVDSGRCGPTCRLHGAGVSAEDSAPSDPCDCGQAPAADRRVVAIEGVAIETSPEGAAALARLLAALDEARAAHRRDLEVRDGELAALKAATPDHAALDALLVERSRAIEGARSLLGPGFDARGQSTGAIRRAAVERLLGPDQLRDRGDAYVEAAFDALVAARTPGNALASHLAAGLVAGGASSRDAALATRNLYLTQAWKGDPVQDHNLGAR